MTGQTQLELVSCKNSELELLENHRNHHWIGLGCWQENCKNSELVLRLEHCKNSGLELLEIHRNHHWIGLGYLQESCKNSELEQENCKNSGQGQIEQLENLQ